MIMGYCKKPTTFNKDNGKVGKKLICQSFVVLLFPQVISSKTLMPFKTMSATLTITFLCFEMSKNCFPTPELFPKGQSISLCGVTHPSHTGLPGQLLPPLGNTWFVLNITARLLYKIQRKPQPFTISKWSLCYYSANILIIGYKPSFSTSSTE